ncbi:response regulator [Aureimonas leprariae]|uniref:histidine kinase n=1 Tax=Plantimonas leprariae TaxID=2615207 RepID=A0A7V7PMJ8_9HYPH|nr:response regulator [Aureimonas leprariae]KAB0678076.1 response regulator [Aureimonas leprariae]
MTTSATLGGTGSRHAISGRRSNLFLGLVGILFALTVLAFAWSLWSSFGYSRSTEAQNRLLAALEDVAATMATMQSSQRGYVLSGSENLLDPYRDAKADLDGNVRALQEVAAQADADAAGVDAVTGAIEREVAFNEEVIALRRNGGYEAATASAVENRSKQVLDQRRTVIRAERLAGRSVVIGNTKAQRLLTLAQTAMFAFAAIAALALSFVARRRQRQVRASAELLTDLMSVAPIGIAFYGSDGALMRSNAEFERIASADAKGGWFSALTAKVGGTERPVVDTDYRFGNAEARTAFASAFPTSRGASGNRGGMGLLVLETTEQLRATAALDEASGQLSAIADNIPQLAWTARPDGEIFWYNRRWFDYTGTTLEEMRGFGWQKLHHPDHVERVVDGYKRAFALGEPWQDTFPLRGVDGTYRWFLSLAIPIRNADGAILRWFGTNTDVTEQRAIEEELLAAKDNADNANRAKSQFIANMSHELRTPLSAVIGYAELLEEEVEDLGETHLLADLKKIEGNARHLLSLINNVLDLSKIEAERMDVYAETFDLATVMDEVASTVGSLVAKKNNTLRIEHDGALGKVHTDQVKVRQCLLNLLSNASKFTENGTIKLRGERTSDGDRDWITLAVTDSGIGMTEEQVEQLFERFRQADASTTRKFGGTGLGLAITQAFCRLLGGDIGATSVLGEGTTFTIRIPAEVTVVEEPLPATAGTLAGGPAGTVLAIDDDPHARELVTRFLSKEGFAVRTASDGVAGLEMARALVPDVILLDVTMPKKDGWSVLAELKEDPALTAIPVVMITIMDEQRLGFALGASDYLLKPVEWDKLKEVMDRFRADGSGMVLAIDDDVDTLSRYATMIEKQGFAFVSATNGRLGLDRVRERKPDLILLDLNMPVMDGFDFLKELRTEPGWQDIPVVVLSSKDLTRAERSTLEGAADQILAKSEASMRELATRIREIVSRQHVSA